MGDHVDCREEREKAPTSLCTCWRRAPDDAAVQLALELGGACVDGMRGNVATAAKAGPPSSLPPTHPPLQMPKWHSIWSCDHSSVKVPLHSGGVWPA